jgi:hypothetical protein
VLNRDAKNYLLFLGHGLFGLLGCCGRFCGFSWFLYRFLN